RRHTRSKHDWSSDVYYSDLRRISVYPYMINMDRRISGLLLIIIITHYFLIFINWGQWVSLCLDFVRLFSIQRKRNYPLVKTVNWLLILNIHLYFGFLATIMMRNVHPNS